MLILVSNASMIAIFLGGSHDVFALHALTRGVVILYSQCTDADSVAHTIYRPGSQAIHDLRKAFGEDIISDSGEIDRKKLGSIVFADRAEMHKLEQIVWPHTKNEVIRRVDQIRSGNDPCAVMDDDTRPIVIVEAAMLLDANWDDCVDGVWVIAANKNVARRRLMETRGLSADEADQRITAQLSRRGVGNIDEEIKQNVVTAVIDNSGDLEDLIQTLREKLDDPKSWY